jgi:hypothetical protein
LAYRRLTSVVERIITPQRTPIMLAVAGGAFWLWATCMLVWVVALPWRHRAESPEIAASAASVEVSPPAASPQAGATPLEPTPRADPGSAGDALARPGDPAGTPQPTAAGGSEPFRNGAATRALDGKWREVARCRRGKAWGKASTTVTFANDGSIAHIDVGPPFTGTPTGECIADTLASTRVEPFNEQSAVLVYRIYVAPH